MLVRLGDITFPLAPRRALDFSNPRRLATINIPGAAPVVQDMGEDRTSLAWEGYLVGEDAYRLAIALEKLKDAGQTVQLLIEGYPELCKPVRVERFPWRLVRRDLVEYSIELVAVIPPPKVAVPTQSGAQTQGGGSQTQVAGSQAGAARTEYTVRSGDTLWAIAQRLLGAGQRWREIAAANGILDPRRLAVGTRLVIPA